MPKDVARLKDSCRSLDLSCNKIRIVPDILGTFSQLKQLNLSSNKITMLPPELGALKKLESLSLNKNLIVSIPSSFDGLVNLRNLDLSDNHITAFPVVLVTLRHLEVVDLSHNKITEIPDGVSGLQASELNLNQNQVRAISASVAQCPRLKVLRLEENCLNVSAVPPQLLTDSQLTLLAVDGNLFEMKDLQEVEGFDKYMERFTATKKKMF